MTWEDEDRVIALSTLEELHKIRRATTSTRTWVIVIGVLLLLAALAGSCACIVALSEADRYHATGRGY